MKLAIIDLDGVVANAEARFAHAEEIKQSYLYPDGKDAINAYWQAVFDPTYVPLDTLIEGVNEALDALREQGYHIIYLTSRPESMRGATAIWLLDACIMDDQTPLVMKPSAFQYTKTIVWKAGMIQHLAAWFDSEDVLIVDDEPANLAEIQWYNGSYRLCKSLAEAIAPVQQEDSQF